jgi:hypothetical protein
MRGRETRGTAHLGRTSSGGWPAAACMATGGGPMAAAAFRRLIHDGRVPHGLGSTLLSFGRSRFLQLMPPCAESSGGRRRARLGSVVAQGRRR